MESTRISSITNDRNLCPCYHYFRNNFGQFVRNHIILYQYIDPLMRGIRQNIVTSYFNIICIMSMRIGIKNIQQNTTNMNNMIENIYIIWHEWHYPRYYCLLFNRYVFILHFQLYHSVYYRWYCDWWSYLVVSYGMSFYHW